MCDMQFELERERKAWKVEIDQWTRELKRKQFLIDSFIPSIYQDKIVNHCRLDPSTDRWEIDFVELTGLSF